MSELKPEPLTIKDWDELAKVPESETHRILVEEDGFGWIVKKNPKPTDEFVEREQYLSSHTFYGSEHKNSTRRLQACGFNVRIASWDDGGDV